jgi:hypothetical protein
VARALGAAPARRCPCGGVLAPGEDECAECRAKRTGGTAVLARDELRPGDTAPQDDVDRAAGGRARSNTVFGRQCEPYENPWYDPFEATRNQAAMLTLVPSAVFATVRSPAASDCAAIWVRYLTGGGGVAAHDGIKNPGDRLATAFAGDDRHEPMEDVVIRWVESNMSKLLPQLKGPPSVTRTFDELGVPKSMCVNLAPDYDNDAFTPGANLAGGLGSSDFGADSRSFDGRVTFDKTPHGGLCEIRPRFEFDWHVLDGVDFCPGNAGNVFQEALTIPMSRLEASGIAKDVGIDIRFRRIRNDAPRMFPNPDSEP